MSKICSEIVWKHWEIKITTFGSKLLKLTRIQFASFLCQMSVDWSNSRYRFAKFPSAEDVCSVLGCSVDVCGQVWSSAVVGTCVQVKTGAFIRWTSRPSVPYLLPSISPVHVCICLKPAHMIILNHFLTTFSPGFRNGSLWERQQCMTFFFFFLFPNPIKC